MKTVSRSSGRSATAAAAYRSACKIVDERTGEIHDYGRKTGVVSTDLVLPRGAPDWGFDRSALWNAAERRETRMNSTVGREFEISLPDELDAQQRQSLALEFAREIVARHRCAADVCIHEPSRKGDQRNHHAHILCSTRRLEARGFTDKTRELDEVKQGEVMRWRQRFSVLQNQHLNQAGHPDRVDHRSLEEQGIKRPPTTHIGPAGTNYERRSGRKSHRRLELEQEGAERTRRARRLVQLERRSQALARGINQADNDLIALRNERAGLDRTVAAGRADVRARFEQYKQQKVLDEQHQREAEQARQPALKAQAQVAQTAATEQRRIEQERAPPEGPKKNNRYDQSR